MGDLVDAECGVTYHLKGQDHTITSFSSLELLAKMAKMATEPKTRKLIQFDPLHDTSLCS